MTIRSYAIMAELVRPDGDRLFVKPTRLDGPWMFPGGRGKPTDENPYAALRRELNEETGLDIEERRLIATGTGRLWKGDLGEVDVVLVITVPVEWSEADEAKAGDGIDDMQWLAAGTALEILPMLPTMVAALGGELP